MNRLRTTLVLSYAIIGVVVLGMALGIWRRSRDSLWTTTLAEVRWNYDLLAIAVIGFALAVAIGLLQRREWGRVFCISLSFIVLFTYVGMPFFATLNTDLGFSTFLGPESYAMGSLAILNVIALSQRRFRVLYSPRDAAPEASQSR